VLFDEKVVEETYGAGSVRRANKARYFQKQCYISGLLEITCEIVEISDQGVNPTAAELDLFRRSSHPLLIKPLKALAVKPFLGDRVVVLAGTYQGLKGRVAGVNEPDAFSIEVNEYGFTTIEARSWEVSRFFCLGDGVMVHDGEHAGQEGYVVAMDGESAVIYVRGVVLWGGVQHETHGDEVRVSLLR
jgi:ribosomal protein L24